MGVNMRITNQAMTNRFLDNMWINLGRLEKFQYQMESGKRYKNISEDPMATMKIMSSRIKLYRIEQHQKNIDSANAWLTQAETNLMQLNGILQDAYENAVQITSDTYSGPGGEATTSRKATASYIAQLRDEVLNLSNGTESERYIFGGHSTTTRPFELIGGVLHYQGVDYSTINAYPAVNEDEIQFEVGYGIYSNATISGMHFMGVGDDNIYKLLDDFQNDLVNGDYSHEDLKHFIGELQAAQSRVATQITEVGGRIKRLELMENRYANETLNYNTIKSKLEDVDLAEATMNFEMARVVYQSSLNVGARIMQTTLLNYIK